mmetsp:Transcript_122833/g.262131  ORF Transcript_122833/g.262131 Transcript_122833/m.262131 type:complete len:551 (+) Transcript_122833:1058-2710(+)
MRLHDDSGGEGLAYVALLVLGDGNSLANLEILRVLRERTRILPARFRAAHGPTRHSFRDVSAAKFNSVEARLVPLDVYHFPVLVLQVVVHPLVLLRLHMGSRGDVLGVLTETFQRPSGHLVVYFVLAVLDFEGAVAVVFNNCARLVRFHVNERAWGDRTTRGDVRFALCAWVCRARKLFGRLDTGPLDAFLNWAPGRVESLACRNGHATVVLIMHPALFLEAEVVRRSNVLLEIPLHDLHRRACDCFATCCPDDQDGNFFGVLLELRGERVGVRAVTYRHRHGLAQRQAGRLAGDVIGDVELSIRIVVHHEKVRLARVSHTNIAFIVCVICFMLIANLRPVLCRGCTIAVFAHHSQIDHDVAKSCRLRDGNGVCALLSTGSPFRVVKKALSCDPLSESCTHVDGQQIVFTNHLSIIILSCGHVMALHVQLEVETSESLLFVEAIVVGNVVRALLEMWVTGDEVAMLVSKRQILCLHNLLEVRCLHDADRIGVAPCLLEEAAAWFRILQPDVDDLVERLVGLVQHDFGRDYVQRVVLLHFLAVDQNLRGEQ